MDGIQDKMKHLTEEALEDEDKEKRLVPTSFVSINRGANVSPGASLIFTLVRL